MAKPGRSMDIQRHGVEESLWEDTYHRFLRTSWPLFFLEILAMFLLLNLVFAGLYYFLAPEGIANLNDHNFWSYFFFSVQTSASIGYGHFYPTVGIAHGLVVAEAVCSLFINALLTGLVFARFSRSHARIEFSKNILWVKYQGQDTLLLRLANARANRVYGGIAKWSLVSDEKTAEGDFLRKLTDLKLVRDETTLFALSWTLIHKIDEASPLFGRSVEEVNASNFDFIVAFTGRDEDTSQTITTHYIYHAPDVVRAKKFTDMIKVDGHIRHIDYSNINKFET